MASTSAEYIRKRLQDPKRGLSFARELIKARIMASAVNSLFHARRKAALTQEDIAKALHTKQPAIARMERDTSGSMSLNRYVQYALTCGVVPLTLLAPEESVREYLEARPDASLQAHEYMTWQIEQALKSLVEGLQANKDLPSRGAITFKVEVAPSTSNTPEQIRGEAPPLISAPQEVGKWKGDLFSQAGQATTVDELTTRTSVSATPTTGKELALSA